MFQSASPVAVVAWEQLACPRAPTITTLASGRAVGDKPTGNGVSARTSPSDEILRSRGRPTNSFSLVVRLAASSPSGIALYARAAYLCGPPPGPDPLLPECVECGVLHFAQGFGV